MKKEFATIALDLEYETFLVYIAALSIDSDDKMYLSRKAQIAYLKVDKASTKFPASMLISQISFHQN